VLARSLLVMKCHDDHEPTFRVVVLCRFCPCNLSCMLARNPEVRRKGWNWRKRRQANAGRCKRHSRRPCI